jgi:hypothetical protein
MEATMPIAKISVQVCALSGLIIFSKTPPIWYMAIPNAAVQIARSPLKNPWVIAPAVKLMPVYLHREDM